MTNAQVVALFCCTFLNVFLIGMQSRNVMSSRILAAVITSFGISIANFTFIHFAATGSILAFLVSAVGGCLGITGSILFYNRFMPMPKPKQVPAETKTVQTMQIKLELDADQAHQVIASIEDKILQLEERVKSRMKELANVG